VNQYDSGSLGAGLSSSGFKQVKEDADLAVVHSCAVTSAAIAKSRQTINLARRENPRAKIVLAGCWPKVYRQGADRAKGVDLVLAKAGLPEILRVAQDLYGFKWQATDKGGLSHNQERGGRYFLKVQDGCEQFCSYCVIPYARGPLSSRPSGDVLAEAKAAVEMGFKEIVLSGIHLGLYGINNLDKEAEEKDMKLYKLIEQLENVDGLKKIRLSSIEVVDVSKEIVRLLAAGGKLCPHLHIPLQSGCDRTLKAMRRPYSTKTFAEKIKEIRRLVPNVCITTDVIVGFPGESDADFNRTFSFIEKMSFSRLHVFPFSSHPQTLAAKLPGHVDEGVKKARAAKLRALSDAAASSYRRRFFGQRLELVVEAVVDGRIKGKSGYYFDVWFSRDDILSANKDKRDLVGEIVEIEMKK
jgi:threonylcarbamoyladenosine tRNA methylthiotransferase MtaB